MSTMAQQVSWLMPLLLLPGIALLINAASTRYSAFQSEIQHLLTLTPPETIQANRHLRTRALRLRTSLVSLHVAACVFVITSILGIALELMQASPYLVLVVCTGIGSAFLIVGLLELSREARLSHEVVLADIDKLVKAEPPQ